MNEAAIASDNRQATYRRLCAALNGASLATIGLIALFTKTPPVYDEPYHLAVVEVIHRFGFSERMLLEIPGAPGPLHACIHFLLEPATHLAIPGVRLVNVGFLALSVLCLAVALRCLQVDHSVEVGSELACIPMIWVISGMALTEMPALAFVTASVMLLFVALTRTGTGTGWRLAIAALGGMCLGLAVSGRQPYFVIVLALPLLLVRWSVRSAMVIVAFALPALAISLSLFSVWNGLVPPRTAYVGNGVSVGHLLLSCGYAAATVLILAPRWFDYSRWRMFVPAAVVACIVLATGAVEITPVTSVAARVLPGALMVPYTRAASALLCATGTYFLTCGLLHLARERHDPLRLFATASMLLVVGSAFKITHQFSSRYSALAAPFILMSVAPGVRFTRWSVVRLAGGAIVGLLSLLSYFQAF